MKKIILLAVLTLQLSVWAQQSINDYQYVVVPTKFEFSKDTNPYRLSTFTKAHLERMGFTVFYDETVPQELINNRCNALYANVERENAFLATKVVVTLKDCQNNLVFKSDAGKSKEKMYDKAYAEALEEAMVSLQNANYRYNGKVNTTQAVASQPQGTKAVAKLQENRAATAPEPTETAKDYTNYLFAQPIKNGYQLVDNTPKVVLKIYKTSNPDYFTAQSDTANGALIRKNGEWFFEYYKDDQPVSEKLLIKF